jgi:DNA repair protein RecO (recombination protein O)
VPQPPRVYKTPAIVLRQRRLGDADKIITLYSAEHGKIDAIAKGVRRMTSRLAGHVEPLNHGSYMIAHGRNLDIITQAQTVETFQLLRDDLDRLSRALYAAELLDRATEERSENFALYRLLLDSLRQLCETRDDLDMLLRFFEMSLLGLLGYRPHLDECVTCGRELSGPGNCWVAELGGVVCATCRPLEVALRMVSVEALVILQALQRARLADEQLLKPAPDVAMEVERVLRDAVHYALDRDVRSATFLDSVRRQRPTSESAGSAAPLGL